MPSFDRPGLAMHYLVDDFTDPWTAPETILLLHGIAEGCAAWYGWIPLLARRFRVVRPDLRGFGASTPMPRDFPWTLDVLVDDCVRLMDSLGIERCHLVGAKVGGNIARSLAARHPGRVITLTVAGVPPPFRNGDEARLPAWTRDFEQNGVEPWARASMASRLGSAFPEIGIAWWAKFMGRTAPSTQIGFINAIYTPGSFMFSPGLADLPDIACPALVITTQGNGVGSVEETRAWQRLIPGSTLLVLPGDSYHVAASDAEICAKETLAFIARVTRPAPA